MYIGTVQVLYVDLHIFNSLSFSTECLYKILHFLGETMSYDGDANITASELHMLL